MKSCGKRVGNPAEVENGLAGRTELLWARGYDRLRGLARHYLRGELPDPATWPACARRWSS